ncbi:MAG: NUDIX hydrolase [Chlamydiales bacterium]|nr:NUDIX hydrolase [Chlamydiia bacterium]MCP5506980.1 NUDIX hydrolase [Chlamydiales bacterium]
MLEQAIRAPLAIALSRYGKWADTIPAMLSERQNTSLQNALNEKQGGRLTEEQEMRLQVIVNQLLKPVNEAFGRKLTAGISPLVTCDVLGEKEGKYLFFLRNGTKSAMFGGIADKGEPVGETAVRECNEESGYGCELHSPEVALVRGYALGGPSPRISIIYRGEISGEPVANHEARDFVWKSQKEIESDSADNWFSAHHSMIKRVFSIQDQEEGYHYMDEPLTVSEKSNIRQSVENLRKVTPAAEVDGAIGKVSEVAEKIVASFNQFVQNELRSIEGFEESRQIIWPTSGTHLTAEQLARKIDYEKKHDWNDFDRLWDLLKPWLGGVLSTNPQDSSDRLHSINKIFNTKIKIREAGNIELVSILKNDDGRYVVVPSENGYQLPSVIQRYHESFPQALYRGIYAKMNAEVKDGSILRALGEEIDPKFEEDSLGNDLRSFIFESNLEEGSIPECVLLLSKDQLLESLLSADWDARHAKIASKLV